MRKFQKKVIYFFTFNLLILVLVMVGIQAVFVLKNWRSDPDVFVIPDSQTYSLLFMGTSRANIFARHLNQDTIEKVLDKEILNLAQPGSGPIMEKIYLELFLAKHNQSKRIIYFIDPYAFYSSKWNEHYFLLPYGVFDIQFLQKSIKNGLSYRSTLNYFKTYLSIKWIVKNPRINKPDLRTVFYSSESVNDRIKFLYPEGLSDKKFDQYSNVIFETIKIAKANDMSVSFIILPTLIPSQPGQSQLIQLLKELEKSHKINYYDLSNSITDKSMYSDIDHLNSRGVETFTEKYLKNLQELK